MTPFKERTFTDEWKKQSGKITQIFWSNSKRRLQVSEMSRSDDWNLANTEYYALIRRALRVGEDEDIVFTEDKTSSLDISSEGWRLKTARLSWLLWMQNNRRTQRIPRELELHTWGLEAVEYRVFVRDAVRKIAQIGLFLEDC